MYVWVSKSCPFLCCNCSINMYVDKLSTFHDQGICSSVQNAGIFTIGQTQLEPRQDEDEGKCFHPRMGSLSKDGIRVLVSIPTGIYNDNNDPNN